MNITDLHRENPDNLYRYQVVVDNTLDFDRYRQTLNTMYGWGWDVRRSTELPNAHWATGMFYRQWTLYLQGDEELTSLVLIS